jgi:RNA polymerase sporulation-specific sigma factor
MLLTKDENLDLLIKYHEGNYKLKEVLIKKNMSLVYSLVNRYKSNNCDREDLIQIGCIGLLKAIDNFNTTFNVQFSTYAVPLILGELKRHFRDGGLIKVSRSLKELSLNINKEKNDYYTKNGKEISLEELSSKLKTSKYDLIMAMESSYLPSSMDEPIYEKDNSSITLEETIKDETNKNLVDLLTLQDGLKMLSDKEKLFIKLRYYQELNQQTIANKFNVSQVQISRLEKKIIDKLKKCF